MTVIFLPSSVHFCEIAVKLLLQFLLVKSQAWIREAHYMCSGPVWRDDGRLCHARVAV